VPKKGDAMPPRVHLSPEPFDLLPTPPVYTFRLDQYRVAETRSPHEDTNVVAFTLTVGDQTYTQKLASTDVNNGNHDVGLEVPGITIDDPATPVTLAFTIINAGHDSSAVEEALTKGVDVLIAHEAGAGNPGTAAAMLAVDAALALIFADCDGTVAADSLTVARSALDATIPANGRVQTHTKHYPGTDSAAGCGANSDYYVTQTIIRTNVGDAHTPEAGQTFIIASRSSGLVLDVTGGASAAGVPIQQYADNGTPAQHWNLLPVEGGEFFVIQSALSGLVLEVAGDSKDDHALIQQGEDLGAYNQHWAFEAVPVAGADLLFPIPQNSNSFYRIRSRLSGKVLDVPSRSAEAVKVQQYAAQTGEANNQLWQLLALAKAPPAVTTGPPEPGTILRGEPARQGRAPAADAPAASKGPELRS
jgi:Ricin-type beta-trefoil lectin domain-like